MMENLFQLLERHAQGAPWKIAVSHWKPGAGFVETTYGELYERAKRFAAALTCLSAGQAIVPMLVGKSADSVAAMLGAVATCKSFCFLNPKYRGPQVAAVLDACAAVSCVVDAHGLVALKGAWEKHPQIAKTTWLVLGGPQLAGFYAEAANALRGAAPVVFESGEEGDGCEIVRTEPPRPDRAGACLFTSGSTGAPKGVLVSEDDLMRRAAAEIAWFDLARDDVLLNVLPFSFDVGLNQLITALAVGGELVILNSWLPADILAATERRKVSGISGVPSIWLDMINAGARFDRQSRHASLRYITVSGGSLSKKHLEELEEVASGAQIFKTYGQTEAFRSTSLRPTDYRRKIESVGKPFPGVHVYVVRDDGTRCPPAEVGEVVHTGLGVMMGYLRNHAAAESKGNKLRKNPFEGHDDPSALAVFTGDMGYIDEEGYLFLKGRRDGMVKVLGNRVYPQEVTNQILTIPGVHDAVVVGIPGAGGQATLVAFVVISPEADLPPSAIRQTLHARLPAFMIPRELVLVDHIPRTASGKPDHRRLVEGHPGTGLHNHDAPPQESRDGLNSHGDVGESAKH